MTASKPASVRIPDVTRRAIEETCRRTGRDFSSVVNEMLSEATKMRRIPGVVFVDSANGRVARIAGTGIEVFEVIKAFRTMDEDIARLRAAYHWLSDVQLRAALAYWRAYPEEIEVRLALEEEHTPEAVWQKWPFTRPSRD